MNSETKRIISFAGFELDPEHRRLMREGRPLHLNAKAFDLLIFLVENAGRVVTKDEILDAVWENRFVEEGNLKVQMSALRKALGEQKDDHRFLLTIPGTGYKFIADVRNGEREIVIESRQVSRLVIEEENRYVANEEKIAIVSNAATSRKVAVGVFVILLIAGGVFWISKRSQESLHEVSPGSPVEKELQIKRLTSKGSVSTAVLSPDAKFFAYSLQERGDYRSSLWVGQTTGSSDDEQLHPAADVMYNPRSFSSDGNWLFYTVSEPRGFDNATLYKMPALGGVPQELVHGVSTYTVVSPDEKQIAFVRGNRDDKTSTLVVAQMDGTDEREIASRPAGRSFRALSLSWSADAAFLAFGAVNGDGKSLEIFAANVSDGSVSQLTALEWNEIAGIDWRTDGSGLVTVAAAKDSPAGTQLWQIDYPSGATRKVTRDLNHYGSPLSLSADSNALLAVQANRESSIWVAPADNLAAAQQVTFSSFGLEGWYGVDWMPDDKIVYVARVDQDLTLWTADADGANARQITSAGFLDERPSATADGKYVVFQSNRSGASDVWRVNADGSDLKQLTTSGGNSMPHSAPDNKTVVFTHESNGASSVRSVSIDGGEPLRITEAATSEARVSPDGKFIACGYVENGKIKLAILPIAGGLPTKLFDVPPTHNFYGSIRWSPDGLFISYRDWANGIWQQSVAGGEPKPLKGLPAEKLYTYVWSPSGKQLAFTRGREVRDAVWITNFR